MLSLAAQLPALNAARRRRKNGAADVPLSMFSWSMLSMPPYSLARHSAVEAAMPLAVPPSGPSRAMPAH
jgi:hypothetical protein